MLQLGDHAFILAAQRQLPAVVIGIHRDRGRLEAHQIKRLRDTRMIQRTGADTDLRDRSARHAGNRRYRAVLQSRLPDELPEFHAQTTPGQLQQIIARRPVGQLQIISRRTKQLDDLMVLGHNHGGRNKALQQHALHVGPEQFGSQG